MPKSKVTDKPKIVEANTSYPELSEIRQDLDSLKDNVVALTKHVQKDGVEQANELGTAAKKQIGLLQARSKKEAVKLEQQVKAKPGQSLAIAFAGGILASLLLRNRG